MVVVGPQPEAWQPSAEEVLAWLGSFRSAKAALIEPNEPAADVPQQHPPEPAPVRPLPPVDWRVAGGMAAGGALVGAGSFDNRLLAGTVGALALLGLYRFMQWLLNQPTNPGPTKYHRHRKTRQRHFAVRADRHGFRFRGYGRRQKVAWVEVVDVLQWPRELVIRLASGEELRVPVLPEFKPWFSVLQQIAAERRRREEELLARMARGLSEPENSDEAHRGLSLSDH